MDIFGGRSGRGIILSTLGMGRVIILFYSCVYVKFFTAIKELARFCRMEAVI